MEGSVRAEVTDRAEKVTTERRTARQATCWNLVEIRE
jgi:hypothetical protein